MIFAYYSTCCNNILPSLDLSNVDEIQFTLVDCPGHASLIRTIIGGAQIIDMMLLVIDVTKGVQTQTAEVREICCYLLLLLVLSLWINV